MTDASRFIIIGENIHCTRKVKRGGTRAKALDDGTEVLFWTDEGTERHLPIPEPVRRGQAFEGGMIPHVAAAVEAGMHGLPDEQDAARAYIAWLARRQLDRGAAFLDVNVDELTPDLDRRNEAMAWLVPVVQQAADVPLSIDSSEISTLQIGLKTYDADKGGGPAMINSASLERPDVLAFAAEAGCPTILLASSPTGMPETAEQRIDNSRQIIDRATAAGLGLDKLYLDPLVFPASSKPEAPVAVLDAIRAIRQQYGPDIHIAGGHSNVSFGLPNRRLLNAVFVALCIDAGGDAGLVDPITCHPDDIARLDRDSEPVQLAEAGFLGKDMFFAEYLLAYRDGRLHVEF